MKRGWTPVPGARKTWMKGPFIHLVWMKGPFIDHLHRDFRRRDAVVAR